MLEFSLMWVFRWTIRIMFIIEEHKPESSCTHRYCFSICSALNTHCNFIVLFHVLMHAIPHSILSFSQNAGSALCHAFVSANALTSVGAWTIGYDMWRRVCCGVDAWAGVRGASGPILGLAQ